MKISVLISIDIVNGAHWTQSVPETLNWQIVQEPIPSEILEDARHVALSKTIYLNEFQELIKKHEAFSIDEIGHNMAVRLSCSRPCCVLKIFAFPELEAHEAQQEQARQIAWRGILKAIADGARVAEKTPQPLKSEGDNADAIPSARRAKASRQR